MPAAPSTASRLSRLSASCAARSPSCRGSPSLLIAVWPEQYRVRACPETTSPWLNPIASDHVTGLTAVLCIAPPAPIRVVASPRTPCEHPDDEVRHLVS